MSSCQKNMFFQSECRLYLGHRLGSTHYWQWSSQEQTFMHTRDWPPSSIRESEIIDSMVTANGRLNSEAIISTSRFLSDIKTICHTICRNSNRFTQKVF
mgnify:CR=1 FL=1